MHYPIPLDLARKVKYLDSSPIWEALLEYLAHRQDQLNSLLFSEDEEDGAIVKRVMKASGGKTEISNLRNLPKLARDICETEAVKAEFADKKGRT